MDTDHKARRQAARSQLVTATILTLITVVKYLYRGHLNYINIALGFIGLLLFFIAFRTLYLLAKQKREAAAIKDDGPGQLN